MPNPVVFFDMTAGGEPVGRITMEVKIKKRKKIRTVRIVKIIIIFFHHLGYFLLLLLFGNMC